jgi:DNA modification methylase
MGGERADGILTDPPYGIGDLMHGWTWAKKQDVQFEKMRDWDAKTEQGFFDMIVSMLAPAVVWGGNYFNTPPSRCWLVWDKPEFPTMSSAELAWTNLDKNTKRIECNRTHQADGEKQHATQKPIAVMQWSLGFLPKGIIYDPFVGSGTTIIACENLSRQCRAAEISPAYVGVALQRYQDAFNITPERIHHPHVG